MLGQIVPEQETTLAIRTSSKTVRSTLRSTPKIDPQTRAMGDPGRSKQPGVSVRTGNDPAAPFEPRRALELPSDGECHGDP